MTSINSKLGFKPAGKRSMMKLPDDRAAAADLTGARCPACHATGVIEHVIHGKRTRMCTFCVPAVFWEPEEA